MSLMHVLRALIRDDSEPEGLALSRLGPPGKAADWTPCPTCLALVRGAHDCPATPEMVDVVRYLVIRFSLERDRRLKRKLKPAPAPAGVVKLEPRRAASGRR